MKRKRSSRSTLIGSVLFFVTIAAVVTVSVLTYGAISASTQNTGVLAVAMFCVIIVLAAVCTVFDIVRRKIMVERPVNKILDATDKIASGDFDVRLEISQAYRNYDEYAFIMENLNKMAAELQKTEVLHTDFIANVSHELKTPLTVIQNYAVALQREDQDAETRKEYAGILADAAKRLTALITNILKLNKLENQELKPKLENIELGEMLAQCVLNFEDLLERKNIGIVCDLDEVYISTAPELLEIVWNNLISNAVKFTDNGGSISVRLQKKDGKAIVSVKDTGCGISRETGEHIFEKFYQGDVSHAQQGNGLGLALVKKVVDVLGGEISVESEVGKGSTFAVTLKGA